MRAKWTTILALLSFTALTGAQAGTDASVPESKRTTLGLYLTAEEAHDLVRAAPASVLFVDIRSIGEVQFLGMPTVADANVPYMLQAEGNKWDETRANFKLVPNTGFAEGIERRLVAKGLQRDDPIILMCRSGERSARAVEVLAKLGYTRVYTLVDGFEGDIAEDGPNRSRRAVNGWKNANLPWSYELDRAKMYDVAQ